MDAGCVSFELRIRIAKARGAVADVGTDPTLPTRPSCSGGGNDDDQIFISKCSSHDRAPRAIDISTMPGNNPQ